MDVKHAFRFKLGHFDCLSVSDGVLTIPDLQPGKARSRYDQIPGQSIEIACLLIRDGKHTVMIDTGFGLMGQPSAGKLMQNLLLEGIQSSEVDTIIVSHIHPDHMGGNTDNEGRSVFPNARYLLYKKEWEYWMSNPDLSKFNQKIQKDCVETIQKRVLPVRSQIDLIEVETDIIDGIKIIQAPGHTPGQVLIKISSGNQQLLCVSDIFHDPSELAGPELEMVGDILPEQASLTRLQILSQIIKPDSLVYACHFPFPGLGYILKRGHGWYWQPAKLLSN
jgi:glyoxylase-like metal-dependent hydrolase (beta-lactamase superfamily II)